MDREARLCVDALKAQVDALENTVREFGGEEEIQKKVCSALSAQQKATVALALQSSNRTGVKPTPPAFARRVAPADGQCGARTSRGPKDVSVEGASASPATARVVPTSCGSAVSAVRSSKKAHGATVNSLVSPKRDVLASEASLKPTVPHRISSRDVAEPHHLQQTEQFAASTLSHSSPLPVASPPRSGTVSIQVRGPDGVVQRIGKLLHPNDTLHTVLLEYLRLRPAAATSVVMGAARVQRDYTFVVPWLRTQYSFDAMQRVTLAEASLCPTATIILQAKH